MTMLLLSEIQFCFCFFSDFASLGQSALPVVRPRSWPTGVLMKTKEGERLPTVSGLYWDCFTLSFKNEARQQQQIKKLFRMRGQTIFIFWEGGIKLMAELFIVAEWVTSCQPASSLMLACLFFFFFEKCPSTPWHSGFEKRTKKL